MADLLANLVKDSDLFSKPLSRIGRRWFTERVLLTVDQTHPENALLDARHVLQTAKAIVDRRLTHPRASLIDKLSAPEQKAIRTRIVYGLLGTNLYLLLPPTSEADDAVIDFILERRFRIIQRMQSFINLDRKEVGAYMSYPEGGTLTAQVSAEARPYWVGTNPDPGNPAAPRRYPFVLSQAGKDSPKSAIETLFTKHSNIADRTRIDCPAAAMVVHLDSLLVGHDPEGLMKKLAAVSDNYIAVDHAWGPLRLIGYHMAGGFTGWVTAPSGPGANSAMRAYAAPLATAIDVVDKDGRLSLEVTASSRDTSQAFQVQIPARTLVETTLTIKNLPRSVAPGAHFSEPMLPDYHGTSDPRADQHLFEQVFVDETDLQTGDHIYVANHPFHRSRLYNTIWNGEHAFVLDPWVNDIGQMPVTGHGVKKLKVADLEWLMLEEINVFLEITRRIVDAWLAIPASRVPDATIVSDAAFERDLGGLLLRSRPAPFQGVERIFNQPALNYPRTGSAKTYAAHWLMELEGTLDPGTTDAEQIDRKRFLIFDYAPQRSSPDSWSPLPRKFKNEMLVIRDQDLVALGGAAKTHYAVSYVDDLAVMPFFMPLYYPIGPRAGKPVRLGFDDVTDCIGVRTPKPDFKIFTVRPPVRTDGPYVAFLKNLGAIA